MSMPPPGVLWFTGAPDPGALSGDPATATACSAPDVDAITAAPVPAPARAAGEGGPWMATATIRVGQNAL